MIKVGSVVTHNMFGDVGLVLSITHTVEGVFYRIKWAKRKMTEKRYRTNLRVIA
jgi:hypothetical protein